MHYQPLLIRSSFRSSGYTEDEIEALVTDLTPFATTQFRRQRIPEAGGSFDIDFIISFTGQAILGGIIGNAFCDLLKCLSSRLVDFYRRKQTRSNAYPETYVLELRFDDVDIRIRGHQPDDDPDANFLSYETLVRLPAIIAFVLEHLRSEPLASLDRQIIHVLEPHPTATSSDTDGLLFSHPWRIEGTLKMDHALYYPHERKVTQS